MNKELHKCWKGWSLLSEVIHLQENSFTDSGPSVMHVASHEPGSRELPRLPSVHLDSCLRGFTTTPSQHLEARFCNTVEQRVGHHGILASGSVDNYR